MIQDDILSAVKSMRNSKLSNYIAPGLTSVIIGGPEHGKVRMFEAERETLEFITPHSHRFNFTAVVLKGQAWNTIFRQLSVAKKAEGDEWCKSSISQVCGLNGLLDFKHTREDQPTHWRPELRVWSEGATYSMQFMEIHSIKFSKGTRVLMFEGPQIVPTSEMLEPWVNGKVVPTFRTEDWMFEKGAV